jgi:hypothetical protein
MIEDTTKKRNSKIEQARKDLVLGGMKEIYESRNTPNFYLRVFCVIAKLGLQNEAHREGLITYDEKPPFEGENKKQYLEKIHRFLITYIR